MARSVLVTLGMNNAGYLSGAQSAKQATKELESAQSVLGDRLMKQDQAMTQLGGVMTGAGLALAGFAIAAVATASQFETAMSSVQSATMAPVAQMGVLRDAALEAGQATSFTATEAAGGIEELGKAGLSTADILGGGLSGALDLAAAGQLSVSDAAEQTATTLSQFKLAGDQATHVADLLAAGAGKAQGGVSDLGQALNQSGLVASQMGLSVEETVGSLTAFAGAGLLGSDAGTSFRTMLMRLTNPTGEAADKLTELGIQTRDANGEFIGMAGLAGQLQGSMEGLTPAARDAAMAIIFGQDAIRAANVLYAEGEDGINDWITKVDDSGYAAAVAGARLDNLGGDIEAMTGAWETAMIRLGSGSQGPLRDVVQQVTEVINAIGDADPAMQGLIFTSAALAGGILLVGGAGLIIIPQIVATQAALVSLGVTAGSVRAAMAGVFANPASWGILAAASLIGVVAGHYQDITLSAAEAAVEVQNSTKSVDIFATAAKQFEGMNDTLFGWAGADEDAKGLEALKDLPGVLANAQKQINEFGSAKIDMTEFGEANRILGDLGKTLAELPAEEATSKLKVLRDEYSLSNDEMATLIQTMPEYEQHLLEQTAGLGLVDGALDTHEDRLSLVNYALGEGSAVVADYSEALTGQATTADDAAGAIAGLADELRNYNSVLYDSLDAEMGYYESVDAARAGLELLNEQLGEGETLVDGMTGELNLQAEAGRNAMQSLQDVGQSTREYAADLWETTGSSEEMQTALQNGWNEVYNLGTQMGLSEAQAKAYADQLVGVPGDVATQIYNTAAEASRGVDGYTHLLGQIPGSVMTRISSDTVGAQATIDTFINNNNGRTITIYTNSESGTQEIRSSNGMTGKAVGGEIIAPGPKGIDSKPFMLAHGEHVWTASEVDMVGGQPAMYRMRELARQGAFRGLAEGGDPYGGWGQVASQSNVSYSSPSYAQSSSVTDARQDNRSLIFTAAGTDEQRLEGLFRRWIREEATWPA